GTPMLEGHDIAWPGVELAADLTAPRAVLEGLARPGRLLRGRGVLPGLVVAGTLSMMQRVEDAKISLPRPVQDRQHVGHAVVRFGHGPHAIPELPALGDEVVVRIDDDERRDVLFICQCRHAPSDPRRSPAGPRPAAAPRSRPGGAAASVEDLPRR